LVGVPTEIFGLGFGTPIIGFSGTVITPPIGLTTVADPPLFTGIFGGTIVFASGMNTQFVIVPLIIIVDPGRVAVVLVPFAIPQLVGSGSGGSGDPGVITTGLLGVTGAWELVVVVAELFVAGAELEAELEAKVVAVELDRVVVVVELEELAVVAGAELTTELELEELLLTTILFTVKLVGTLSGRIALLLGIDSTPLAFPDKAPVWMT
jgi:hypothetical protein